MLAVLTTEQRAAITQALAARVERSLREVLEHWYSTSAQDGPRIDVFAAERRDGTLVLHVIAVHHEHVTEYEDSSYEPRTVRDRWRDQLRRIAENI